MSDAHGQTAAPATSNEADVQSYQKQDVGTGRMIISLMTGIFAMGLLLYIIVAYFVHGTP